MDESRINRLSKRHRDVLSGVAQLRKTKQIAAELGIAPGTVDGYIAEAVRLLGAADRGDAARQFVEYARQADPGLSGGESPWVGAAPASTAELRQPDVEPEAARPAGAPPHRRSVWQLPIRRPGQRTVDMPIGVRLLWIPVIAVVLAIGFGAVVNGLQVLTGLIESLSRLAR